MTKKKSGYQILLRHSEVLGPLRTCWRGCKGNIRFNVINEYDKRLENKMSFPPT